MPPIQDPCIMRMTTQQLHDICCDCKHLGKPALVMSYVFMAPQPTSGRALRSQSSLLVMQRPKDDTEGAGCLIPQKLKGSSMSEVCMQLLEGQDCTSSLANSASRAWLAMSAASASPPLAAANRGRSWRFWAAMTRHSGVSGRALATSWRLCSVAKVAWTKRSSLCARCASKACK